MPTRPRVDESPATPTTWRRDLTISLLTSLVANFRRRWGCASTVAALAAFSLLTLLPAQALTILQGAGSGAVGFESESYNTLLPSAPTSWVLTNEPAASGGKSIFQSGQNDTAAVPSFVVYQIKFATPGTYTVYYRWRADKNRTDQDVNGGNSFRLPNDFGDLSADTANYVTASVNNQIQVPAANSYNVFKDAKQYTVTQEQVNAGTPLILKVGTREQGMLIDRLVLSTNDGLNESDFNALANSPIDEIDQGDGQNYVAFEAERAASIAPSAPTTWVLTNEAAASGGAALFQSGQNDTTAVPSLAAYHLKFVTPGTYTFYYRWRADKNRTDQDINGGNSFRVPNDFGDLTADAANYVTASVNNQVQVPAANSFNVFKDGHQFTVSQGQIDAGGALVLKIGTREQGMLIDRFVLSLNDSLSEADFNALPNSGADSTPPQVTRAAGLESLTGVRVSFSKPLDATSVTAGNFTISGSLGVTGAVLDSVTLKDVLLTTGTQTTGTVYTVTVNGVKDVSGNQIAANSKVTFTAVKLATGWVKRDFYFNIAGAAVSDLVAAPVFPDAPSKSDVARGFQIDNDPSGVNYGARVSAFFIPPSSGVYEFYLYSDDQSQLDLSSDDSEANLSTIVENTVVSGAFDPNVVGISPPLTGGHRYLLRALLKQDAGEVRLGVGVRKQGDNTPVTSLPILGGSQIATYINPDDGKITFKTPPANQTAPAFGRAEFSVVATSAGGALYYQWQVNDSDIPGANRPQFITPVLSASDSGKKYRCVVTSVGNSVPSTEAMLTVVDGEKSPLSPYVG
ncbi:MAG TPA: Ig-like domain-containing protein, partial [Candidatus Limnocylindria bacterium]|nr:Ig-like domain-containing protein [Candidatus Limnocylindria bacterium]